MIHKPSIKRTQINFQQVYDGRRGWMGGIFDHLKTEDTLRWPVGPKYRDSVALLENDFWGTHCL